MKPAQKNRMVAYLVIACVILLVTTKLATKGQLDGGYEFDFMMAINSGIPNSLTLPFLIVTQAGSAWMLFGVTLLLLAYRKYRTALRVFGAGTIAFLLTEIIKNLVQRPRPYLLQPLISVRETTAVGYGFPSGHTAVATTVALLLMPLLPKKWRWLSWAWILLVALSRVYLGVHAPLDVVGGFAIGVIVVCILKLVHGKLRYVRKITGLKLTD